MREITEPLSYFPLPYLFYKAREPGQRQLSPAQQRILDTMRVGVWYASEEERVESCRALVWKGWCVSARIAKRNKDGVLYEPEAGELLVAVFLGDNLRNQPLEVYRRVVDGEGTARAKVDDDRGRNE